MSVVISVPGKSFIVGEYLALKKGGALTFASSPQFQLTIQTKSMDQEIQNNEITDSKNLFHPESPAGKLYSKFIKTLENYDLKFFDPYKGLGGWGSSTAQFLSLYCFLTWKDALEEGYERELDIKLLLDQYRELAHSGIGYVPSGSDLIGQFKGGITFFDSGAGQIARYPFVFPDIELCFFQTGNKVSTYEHLINLPDFPIDGLESSFKKTIQGLKDHQSELFVEGVREYGKALLNLGFVCSSTQVIMDQILKLPGVLAVKGCGAMGADVILVITERQNYRLKDWLLNEGFHFSVRTSDISKGVHVLNNDYLATNKAPDSSKNTNDLGFNL